jgi:hypothetical protein
MMRGGGAVRFGQGLFWEEPRNLTATAAVTGHDGVFLSILAIGGAA